MRPLLLADVLFQQNAEFNTLFHTLHIVFFNLPLW